ncbi:MAG TPA: polysaccharide deacetylase [Candidatus Binataceae bacterium]|nr:polysaccharide deacetylase [Candidatus Binataceae bacterium]
MTTNISVCLTFDFDAICVWLGSLKATSPSAISRGEFGAVATERLLQMLARWDIRSTWFIPGHTIDSYPDLVRRVADAGHEIGHHNYCHENPISLTRDEEQRVLDRGTETIRRATGKAPEGFRSPAWDLSPHSLELLLERGFLYDSSLMGNDYSPYYCRIGDVAEKDGPYRFGREVDMVELPVTWGLDDFPAFEWLYGVNQGLSAPSQVYERWAGDFDFLCDFVGAGVYCLTMHPQVIGRGHRMLMLDRLVRHIKERAEARFVTMAEVARAWKRAHPLPSDRASR